MCGREGKCKADANILEKLSFKQVDQQKHVIIPFVCSIDLGVWKAYSLLSWI